MSKQQYNKVVEAQENVTAALDAHMKAIEEFVKATNETIQALESLPIYVGFKGEK